MNDDELIDALRRTFRARAASVTPSKKRPPVIPQPEPRPVRSIARRPLTFGVAAATLAAAAAIALILTSTGNQKGTGVSVTIPPVANTPATTAPLTQGTPATTPPMTAPVKPPVTNPSASAGKPGNQGNQVAAGFKPLSVTFVSSLTGWVFGGVPCGTSLCAAIARTSDGGLTWTSEPAPPISFSVQSGNDPSIGTSIRFANGLDGWIYTPYGSNGASKLWSTYDGGQSWSVLPTPGGPSAQIMALEAGNGAVYAVTINGSTEEIFTAPAAKQESWSASTVSGIGPGAGPVPRSQLVLQASTGWLVDVDRTVVGGARLSNSGWTSWTPPCSGENGTAALAAASPNDLYAVCAEGTWGPPRNPPHGATIPSFWLYTSHDAGNSFSPVAQLPSQEAGSISAAPGTSGTITVAGAKGILASFDGGHSWQYTYTSGADNISYIGFTTATQGVAIEDQQPDGAFTMLMTRDGGHTWAPVQF
jgi:photosystem II stability/assembly factor-like uncharacterized protein